MTKLTKQDKVVKYHYETKRFQTAMEEYLKYLQAVQVASNREEQIQKNDQGLSREAKDQALKQLEEYRTKSQSESDARMAQAVEAFETMRTLLK